MDNIERVVTVETPEEFSKLMKHILVRSGGQGSAEFMDKFREIDGYSEYNVVSLVNTPHTVGVAITVSMSKIHCMKNVGGFSALDMELFEKMPRDSQLKELEAILNSLASLHTAVGSAYSYISGLGNEVHTLYRKLIGEQDNVSEKDYKKE